MELLTGVELPRELSIAMDLYQQKKQRAARAWVRSYLGNLPPGEDAEQHLTMLPPVLREALFDAPGSRPSTDSIPALEPSPRGPVPRWFVWGLIVAAMLSLLAQMAFVITKLKQHREQQAQAKAQARSRGARSRDARSRDARSRDARSRGARSRDARSRDAPQPKPLRRDWDPTLTYKKARLLCGEGMAKAGLAMVRKALARGFREPSMRALFRRQEKVCLAAPFVRQGRAFLRKKQYHKAKAAFLRALDHAPTQERIKEAVARCEEQLALSRRRKKRKRRKRRKRRRRRR